MKVSLVVASGAHQGKLIPLTGPQFLIGRDSQCHLRPASQAISKRHCGIIVRDGKVYIKDFGSTNGTTVNDEQLKDAEIAVADGASLKIGPLDFIIRIELRPPIPDGTPLPGNSPESAAALAAVKAVTGSAKTPGRDATPDPSRLAKPAGSKETPALTGPKDTKQTAAPAKPSTDTPSASTFDSTTDADHDRIAAMLLDMDDGSVPVPDGSTVIDSPAINERGEAVASGGAKPDDKGKKPVQSREEMSNAASDLLRRMMRRPK